MKITAYAGRKKVDLRDHCESLKLGANFDNEPELLAAIYRCLVFGGRLRAEPKSGSVVEIEFP